MNPNYEYANQEEVISFAIKNKYDLPVFSLNGRTIDSLRRSPFKPKWEKGFRPLQFKVFNRDQKLISFYASCEGPMKHYKIFDTFPTRSVNFTDTNWTLQMELATFKNLNDGESYNLNKGDRKDMYIIAYWATWLGYPGKHVINKIKEYKKKIFKDS